MTTDELKELLGKVTPGEWRASSGHIQQNGQMYWQVENEYDAIMQNQFCWAQGDHDANATLIAISPKLARRVIAAEKLLAAAKEIERWWIEDEMKNHMGAPVGMFMIRASITEYEATK